MNSTTTVEMHELDYERVAVLSGSFLFSLVLFYLGTRAPKIEEEHQVIPQGYKPQNESEEMLIEEYEKNQKLTGISFFLKNIRWVMAIYIFGVHVLAFMALPHLYDCKTETLLGAIAFYQIGGFGVTGGLHRLYAHKSYKGNAFYRFITMICTSVANQGTIYHWARDHRTHHKYSETKSDPHNALRGFFFAHVGWLLMKKDPRVKLAGLQINMQDIAVLPEVKLQKRLDPIWNLFWCFFFPALVANMMWGEDLYKGFMVMGVFKYVVTLNITWLVNSAAHLYGETVYDEHANPAENPVVSFLSMGEGFHSYHHAFPMDYAASEFGVTSQYNPTKLIIDIGAALGLVTDRKRCTHLWEQRQKKREILDEFQGVAPFTTRVLKKKNKVQ